ncbi:MAG: SOS response-associated peptidase [Rhodospirillales bacterium]|nr:SOS response-associated peptidase [Rhodospirillales bacterium]MDE0379378.1 SOS response-associated peptidase [Rhodospirillales bacterium]
MCGRFTQRMTWRELHERMDLIGTPLNLRPRYNVAPSQDVAIVRANDDGRSLCMLRWGLIPSWAREPNIGYKLINARTETAAEKPSFRSAWRHRRCLIPADGFYEWRREGKTRQPWLFGLKDAAPFAFAGLWESWAVPAGAALTGSLAERSPGDTVGTFTILTTAANETVTPVHGRMPVILPEDAYGPWLAGEEVPLAPYPADAMTAHPVSTLVNRPANDDPRCVEPITLN